MLTAEQARKLSGRTTKEKVEALLVSLEKKASEGGRMLRCGYDHKEDEDLWIHGGYNNTEEHKEAVEILKGLGYEVSFYYQDGSFAVDMYTKVEW